MPRPVWPYKEVPIDTDEVRQLCDVEQSRLAAQAERMSPGLRGAALRHDPNNRELPRSAAALPRHGSAVVGDALGPVLFNQSAGELLVVIEQSEQLNGRLIGADGAVLAAWECSQEDLDLFTSCVSHVLFRYLR